MFPVDPMWIYIAAPAAVVSTLILIKIRQRRTHQHGIAFKEQSREPLHPSKREAKGNSAEHFKKAQPRLEVPDEPKPDNCQHYLGYLYMQKAPEKTHIPTECYNCRKLLQCLYSPKVIEEVYGE